MKGEFEKQIAKAIYDNLYKIEHDYVTAEALVKKVVDEARKDLQLPIPYKHVHKPHTGSMTCYADEDIEAFKEKLEKWLGNE